MKSKFTLPAILMFTLLVTTKCNLYPDSETRVEDLDIVLTLFDQDAQFQNFQTYSIVDEVAEISLDTTTEPLSDISSEISDFIIDVVNLNMQTNGWVLVDANDDPDVGINLGGVVNENISVITYPSYWYYYGGYWGYPGGYWGYPGYGYYYPWGGATYVASYEVGTLIIDMVDLKNMTRPDRINDIWAGVVRGVLESSSSSNKSRLKEGIDQAFEQSTYLTIE